MESNWEMLFTNLQFILNFVWIHVNNEICFIITKYSICTVCFKNKSYHVNKRVLKPLLKLEMWYYFISNGVPQTFQNTISFLSDVSTCWHPKLNCKKKKRILCFGHDIHLKQCLVIKEFQFWYESIWIQCLHFLFLELNIFLSLKVIFKQKKISWLDLIK